MLHRSRRRRSSFSTRRCEEVEKASDVIERLSMARQTQSERLYGVRGHLHGRFATAMQPRVGLAHGLETAALFEPVIPGERRLCRWLEQEARPGTKPRG